MLCIKACLLAAVVPLTAFAPHAQAQTRRTATPAQALPPDSATTPANRPMPPADPLIPVEAGKRKPITDDLQATVSELLELFHDSKQSHWNLRGPLYLPLHKKLQRKRR